jgi:pantothenate synthetase
MARRKIIITMGCSPRSADPRCREQKPELRMGLPIRTPNVSGTPGDKDRQVTVISKILADLVRTVQLIESDIVAEEEQAKISNRSDAKYPILARSLIERRDNIKLTIAALEQRFIERAQHEQVATAA